MNLLGGAFLITTVVLVALTAWTGAEVSSGNPGGSGAPPLVPSAGGAVELGTAAPLATSSTLPALRLGIAAQPGAICAFDSSLCPAGTGEARVTLTAGASTGALVIYPNIQVAFLLETTLYDGVFDPTDTHPGTELCADGPGGMPCEESNGVPFFEANAGAVAESIQRQNPESNVSFALIDFGGTMDSWDDAPGDSGEYAFHVDTPSFLRASEFGQAVRSSLQYNVLACSNGWSLCDSDFADNILHSSSITALYGAIEGGLLPWEANSHHVIVLIGSTAPRDANYIQDYCVSPSVYTVSGCPTQLGRFSSACEPAYLFPQAAMPACEGWVKNPTGDPLGSIAALAHNAPACASSLGGRCTIDTIDLWTTPTDPYSAGWPGKRAGGGPGGAEVVANVVRVLRAGCDLALATGGTWDGPAFFSCPDGTQGSLQYVPHGPASAPNTGNPTLFSTLTHVGFGPIIEEEVAHGWNRPMFTFVPFANFTIAPTPGWTSLCVDREGNRLACPAEPTILRSGGLAYYGWNFSNDPARNALYAGETWTVSFNVVAYGPPYLTVPIDACVTPACIGAGSQARNGVFSEATYIPVTNRSIVNLSFPLARIIVEPLPITPPGGGVPQPLPPLPPPPGVPVVPPIPVAPAVPVISSGTTVPGTAVQATAAGLIAAGFMRTAVRNRPVAVGMAVRKPGGVTGSRFDKEGFGSGGGRNGTSSWRWE